jgi:hypothetical protein
MNKFKLNVLFITILLSSYISALSQGVADNKKEVAAILDSLKSNGIIYNDNRKKPEIFLSTDESVKYLREKFQPGNWKDTNDPLRVALGQLIYEASHLPYDSSKNYLKAFPYDSINIPWDKFYIWEPLKLKIPVVSPPQFKAQIDSAASTGRKIAVLTDSLGKDSVIVPSETITLSPQLTMKDTTILVVIDTLHEVASTRFGFPFKHLNYPFQSDSIQVAVNSLLKYLDDRDSTIINFTGIDNSITPVWMNSKSDKIFRYWLKNEFADSVTVWIGNPSRNTISLFLEQGVNFRRPARQNNYAEAKINVKSVDDSKLLDARKIVTKTQYWKYKSEAAFLLNQSAITNWVKGGENNIAAGIDITGYADYTNKELKLSSNNFARLKLGFLSSASDGIRKNSDLLETNSKLNHTAFGKFDFSAIMLFKTQVAHGFNYPNDSVIVSKFLNPATLTIGFGLDYKPNKNTSINFSPFSYKGTFMTDTGSIDQTRYGIPKDRKALHEPGFSFMISNEFKPFKMVTVTNRLQLFTNYANNPQNIDVDWEMIAVANLNWFTDVRFNTHLIFDDDTKTVEYVDDKPVLNPDGSQKKTARVQFKEILSISLIFRF